MNKSLDEMLKDIVLNARKNRVFDNAGHYEIIAQLARALELAIEQRDGWHIYSPLDATPSLKEENKEIEAALSGSEEV